MKALPIVILIFVVPLGISAEESCILEDVHFIPPRYYLGDRITLRLTILRGDGCRVVLPESYPSDDWIKIHRIGIEEKEKVSIVSIEVSTYFPGERALLPIQLGDFRITGLKLSPASLIEERGAKFEPLRDQLLIPGSRLYLFGILSVLVFIAVFFSVLFSRLKTMITGMIRIRKKHTARRIFLQELTELEESIRHIDIPFFYKRLGTGVKRYLLELVKIDYFPLTTEEMDFSLRQFTGEEADEQDLLIDVLRRGDAARFGMQKTAERQLIEDVDLVRKYFYKLEHITGAKDIR
jgi:hypothetical protein